MSECNVCINTGPSEDKLKESNVQPVVNKGGIPLAVAMQSCNNPSFLCALKTVCCIYIVAIKIVSCVYK